LKIIEAAINDRDNWRRTAQAVIALYKSYEDVYSIAGKRESDRAFVSLAARTVIEKAICESPISGGRQASKEDIDELIALTTLLIEAATDSDAINFDLVEPKLKLYLNGEYGINRDFYDDLIKPFLRNYQKEEYEDAAESYSELYRRELNTKRTLASEIYSTTFNAAFKCEFGLTPDEAIDGFAELMDIAVEQQSIIVQTTRITLIEKLTQKRGLSNKASEAFLKMVGLHHRPTWITPPDGYGNKDLEPWRYRRRLSVTVKPVLIFGENDFDVVIYGAGIVQQGFSYLLRRSERGHLPDKFFMTQEMKQYIGSVSNERGHAFARRVADKLSELGWQVRNEVNMSELGAPKKEADGDIDVLAWKPDGEVLLIECKRLQLARTVAEIAEICRRFKGNAKDELDKHVRRVNWVINNPASLNKIVGFLPSQKVIDSRLVTNTHVPMMYINSLPIPANKIVPISGLN
jgi:Holliday junction resolvase